jgi:tRNA uridine 5-carboxymethylaminomethyl modification enzyme
VAQQEASIRAFERDERLRLPPDIDYARIHGLSTEERAALQLTRPESVGQARRIEGVTPAGALRLLAYVRTAPPPPPAPSPLTPASSLLSSASPLAPSSSSSSSSSSLVPVSAVATLSSQRL